MKDTARVTRARHALRKTKSFSYSFSNSFLKKCLVAERVQRHAFAFNYFFSYCSSRQKIEAKTMPYPVNYFLSKLQNSSRNAIFEDQTNLFQIIDSSNGTILDTTVDCLFLSYLSGVIQSFEITGNNQICLSEYQIFEYIGVRMYYYNPRLLDTSFLNLLPLDYWADCPDPTTFASISSSLNVLSLLLKQSSLNPNLILSQDSGSVETRASLNNLNNYFFRSLFFPDDVCGYSIIDAGALSLNVLNNPFTFTCAFSAFQRIVEQPLFLSYEYTDSIYLKITILQSSSTLTVNIYLKSPISSEEVVSAVFNIPAETFVMLCITSDGSALDIYANSFSSLSNPISVHSTTILTSRVFGSNPITEGFFNGFLYELFAAPSYSTETKVSQLFTLLKTKYFLLT